MMRFAILIISFIGSIMIVSPIALTINCFITINNHIKFEEVKDILSLKQDKEMAKKLVEIHDNIGEKRQYVIATTMLAITILTILLTVAFATLTGI